MRNLKVTEVAREEADGWTFRVQRTGKWYCVVMDHGDEYDEYDTQAPQVMLADWLTTKVLALRIFRANVKRARLAAQEGGR